MKRLIVTLPALALVLALGTAANAETFVRMVSGPGVRPEPKQCRGRGHALETQRVPAPFDRRRSG